MSFDGVLLNRLSQEFNILKTGRISKITESGDTDFIFTIRANRVNHNIMLSFSSDFARIHFTNKQYDSITNPKSFTMFLRKHIEGYFIEDIKTYHCDRIIYFTLTGYNEMQDLNKKYLVCEVMGRYSNLILTNENFIILDSLKHDGIGEYNRTILPNALYEFPETNKLNPLDYSKEELNNIFNERKPQSPKDVMAIFNGVSLNLAYPIFECDKHADMLYDLLHINNNPSIFINFKGKEDFYYNPFNNEIKKEFNTISEMLDDYYYQSDLKAKVKLKTNDLSSFVNKQIIKHEKKIKKLNQELMDSNKNEEIKLYGELLLSLPNLKDKKDKEIVFNYYNNEYIEIPLDKKYTILENSNRYYKKYQKAKSSIGYIKEQIEIAKNEIDYFSILKYQLSDCGINEALEIQEELVNNKYLFN
ncbi:MAG: NFACT family protein, partial [Acholeplasmatales bacterium]|nr:NFACT family protein [Acholeplasmatales bacterium]